MQLHSTTYLHTYILRLYIHTFHEGTPNFSGFGVLSLNWILLQPVFGLPGNQVLTIARACRIKTETHEHMKAKEFPSSKTSIEPMYVTTHVYV